MENTTFFSNTNNFLDHGENEAIISPSGTRLDWQAIFTVPSHNVGTDNLMVFLDGKLCIRGRDYTDINSGQISFSTLISPSRDFHAILVKTMKGIGEVVEAKVTWEDF